MKDKSYMKKPLKKFRLSCSIAPHYVEVLVWKNQKQLNKAIKIENAAAVFEPCKFSVQTSPDDLMHRVSYVPPCIGKLHFNFENWGDMVVVHELYHAMAHRMRVLYPYGVNVVTDYYGDHAPEEEVMADEMGMWAFETFGMLYDLWDEHKNEVTKRYNENKLPSDDEIIEMSLTSD